MLYQASKNFVLTIRSQGNKRRRLAENFQNLKAQGQTVIGDSIMDLDVHSKRKIKKNPKKMNFREMFDNRDALRPMRDELKTANSNK